jgi:NAD(P)-dependent dehydrogenase (short-subunit alcohol dehydrogenase family)
MRLNDKVCIITGAASGFGRASAVLFAVEGAKVVVCDVDDQSGKELVNLIKHSGGEAIYIHTDCGVVSDMEKMVKTTVETYGKINIFWHNAGIAGPGRLEGVTEEAYDRCMAVHVKGGMFGAKFVIPEMKKIGGGSILFTTSSAAYRALSASGTYSMAKASLDILSKVLARQYAKDNIRVNCISPGPSKTGLWEKFQKRDPSQENPEEYERRTIDQVPMGHLIEAEDIAKGALYLVSEEARFITGTHLSIDGGQTA